jgi:mRNA-degrading endonuclease toxin of MazEF toxin-antitoxin module
VLEAGDIVWLNFTPQAGHEQAGHRAALVLSPASYNRVFFSDLTREPLQYLIRSHF